MQRAGGGEWMERMQQVGLWGVGEFAVWTPPSYLPRGGTKYHTPSKNALWGGGRLTT